MKRKKIRKPSSKAASQQQSTKRRSRRRRGRNVLYYLMFAFVALATGVILSLTVFFNIESIEVQGGEKYQPSAIVAVSGTRIGDNLFRVDSGDVKQRITSQYAYVEDVRIRRHLPAKLVIQITDATPMVAFEQGLGYVLVSDRGRILELGEGEIPQKYLKVVGMDLGSVIPCTYLPQENQDEFQLLTDIVMAITENKLDQVTKIDLTDELNIAVEYDDRLRIELGGGSDILDKIGFAKYAIDNNIRRDFEGVVDVTIPKRVSTMPQEIHGPGYHENDPIPGWDDQESEPPQDENTDADSEAPKSDAEQEGGEPPAQEG